MTVQRLMAWSWLLDAPKAGTWQPSMTSMLHLSIFSTTCSWLTCTRTADTLMINDPSVLLVSKPNLSLHPASALPGIPLLSFLQFLCHGRASVIEGRQHVLGSAGSQASLLLVCPSMLRGIVLLYLDLRCSETLCNLWGPKFLLENCPCLV